MIFKVLGSLLFIEAGLQMLCMLVAFYYGEPDLLAFNISFIITLFGALFFRYLGRQANNSLTRRDAYLVVTLSWVIFSMFGTLPFLISGYVESFTDAYFETMSGFTTTGATIIDDVEALPHGLLFFRSLTQWIGGLGIVFFTIALLPSMTGGSVRVFAAEATGPIRTKLHPRLSTSAKWIWSVYIILTIACGACYYYFGMSDFDAVNYAMTTTATGGFATHNMSTEFFRSPAIEYTCIVFCFLSGVNFVLLGSAVMKLKFKQLVRNSELRLYLSLIAGATFFIMLELIIRNGYGIEHAFRSSLFQVVSFITTTGLFSDDAALWPHVTWIALAALMFVGGMSGSTAGGLKCIRLVMIVKMVKNEFRQLLHPNAVIPLSVDGNNVSQQKRNSLLALISVYLMLIFIQAFVLSVAGIDSTNAITIILSSLGNVGPTLGIEIGPTMSWSVLPVFAKWMCVFSMLLGRLEFFSVLVIFTRSFWKDN